MGNILVTGHLHWRQCVEVVLSVNEVVVHRLVIYCLHNLWELVVQLVLTVIRVPPYWLSEVLHVKLVELVELGENFLLATSLLLVSGPE